MDRVMVVDDDSTSLAICKALLAAEYEVVLMKSGLQALGYLKEHKKPDVILLDMIMPGTDGMETLRLLKDDPGLSDIPVLFMTSSEDDHSLVEGYSNGAVDFIKKPVQPSLLRIKLKHQLAFTQLQKENRLLRNKLQLIQMQVDKICGTVEKPIL